MKLKSFYFKVRVILLKKNCGISGEKLWEKILGMIIIEIMSIVGQIFLVWHHSFIPIDIKQPPKNFHWHQQNSNENIDIFVNLSKTLKKDIFDMGIENIFTITEPKLN